MKKLIIFIFTVVLLGSCNKYSEKVAGTYSGQMTINDSIISSNVNIIFSEISNKRISIESNFFNLYELEIEKQRYFSSVTFFHYSNELEFEIGETSTGLFLSLLYYDNLNNQYSFSGEN